MNSPPHHQKTTPSLYLPTFTLLLPPTGATAEPGFTTHNQERQPHFLLTPNQPMPVSGQVKCHTLGILEVVSPKRPNLVLATHIPNCEADILVLHRLHIESFGGKTGDGLLAANTRSASDALLGSFVFPALAMIPARKQKLRLPQNWCSLAF